jgi:hypothetical protein
MYVYVSLSAIIYPVLRIHVRMHVCTPHIHTHTCVHTYIHAYMHAGEMMYSGLLRNFTGPTFFTQPPEPCPGGDIKCVSEGFKQLYAVIAENGYAFGGSLCMCLCV